MAKIKESTMEKALRGTLILTMGRMVSADGADGTKYFGIVCDSSSFEKGYKEQGLWAIWENSQREALESYEKAHDHELIPGSSGNGQIGKLSFLTANREFEILDEDFL